MSIYIIRSNEEVNSSESRNSDGIYEEIENEIYHDAEWRFSETESSCSEATHQNDYENTDICNEYEELDETSVEVHNYEIWWFKNNWKLVCECLTAFRVF